MGEIVEKWVMMSHPPKNNDLHYQTISSGRLYDSKEEALADHESYPLVERFFPVLIRFEQLDGCFHYDKNYKFIIENTNEN